ncbi:MAG: hypothetical protein C4303_04925 [candidate division GAL15 bacterium]
MLHPVDSRLLSTAQDLGPRQLLCSIDALYTATAALVGAFLVWWNEELVSRAGASPPSGGWAACDRNLHRGAASSTTFPAGSLTPATGSPTAGGDEGRFCARGDQQAVGLIHILHEKAHGDRRALPAAASRVELKDNPFGVESSKRLVLKSDGEPRVNTAIGPS